jgi:ketosteroid isomerase-like protein
VPEALPPAPAVRLPHRLFDSLPRRGEQGLRQASINSTTNSSFVPYHKSRAIPSGVRRVHEGEPRARQEAVVSSQRREPHEPPGLRRTGWDEIAGAMDRAASPPRDGSFLGYETVAKRVTSELAYVVEVEHLEAKVHGGQEITPYALRVTMILEPEDGAWKVVHRHADQVTSPQPAESAVQR